MDETPVPADGAGLAYARVRFLTSESVRPEEVRPPVLASWRRSREFAVPADRIDLPYLGEQDLDTPLIHSAEPVLRRLGEQLDGQPISLILTGPDGVVLTQRTGDTDLHRHLEGVELVPGFSYGERFVGTNGIGTALQQGRPMHVFGHEHYAEHLENLACAGVPLHDPITGRMLGAIDVTCWRRDAGATLVALARTTAEQVRSALLQHSDVRELVLFQAYLQACRRTTGIVLAFNDEITMMNDRARQLLDPNDQSVLLGHATEALATGRRATATVALPTGNKVRMDCRRVTGRRDGETAGGVLTVQLIEPDEGGAGAALPFLRIFLPGVVGSAPAWLRCCHEVEAGYDRGEWLVLAGEPGTGKHALASGMHRRRNPGGRLHTLDAAEAGAQLGADVHRDLLDDPVDTLVIRHADRLSADTVRTLTPILRRAARAGPPTPWVVVTVAPGTTAAPRLAALLSCFSRTVAVPPLRRRPEDVGELVPLFLGKLGHGETLTCSPAALHLLMRAPWPGNAAELYRVLTEVTRHRLRRGTIRASDLPPEYRTAARRSLSRLESIERDAIVHALEDAAGNKTQAARLLGMSRATIYRKIHEFGIVETRT